MKEIFKKWGLITAILLLSIGIITGCGAEESSAPEDTTSSTTEEKENTTKDVFPVTITDDANREITIEKAPESIVSIQTSNTEIAFALGLGDKVIGVSDYCNYPAETANIQKVGGQDINAELVLSLMPDMALVTDYHYNTHPKVLQQFEDAGIEVVVVGSASSFEDVYKNIEMLGNATGTSEKAEEIIVDMKERHQAIKDKALASIKEKKRVWVEVSPAPDIFTTGKNTFMHEMLESIQATNVAEDQEGWVKLNEEEIVKLNPDVVITTYGYYIDNPSEQVLAREGWAEVPAVKNGEVFDVDNDTVTRPGPRLIEGVETLAELIYPETFKQ
ncbi:iron complex transport system substrate-binding protein [Ureibacillus xyleni]|uniref:Iron complex transport system substrate-binding protein n=1 Tax=Ureibacillus xyleni TaxID=614648 RepID=A0A285SU73_9BACL|nr:ABC transporter substrate-binding protein [Ureibacillus xyleni]SOC11415.1 iron complex transport system substrate-binding protein [Ureibacillus xyleni]